MWLRRWMWSYFIVHIYNYHVIACHLAARIGTLTVTLVTEPGFMGVAAPLTISFQAWKFVVESMKLFIWSYIPEAVNFSQLRKNLRSFILVIMQSKELYRYVELHRIKYVPVKRIPELKKMDCYPQTNIGYN